MMSANILQIVRLAWFLALGAMLSAFRDALHLTRARHGAGYLHAATRARVILGAVEGLLVTAAVTATMLLPGADAVTALLGGRGPLDLPGTTGLSVGLPAGAPDAARNAASGGSPGPSIGITRNGRCSDTQWPTALCCRSGAYT